MRSERQGGPCSFFTREQPLSLLSCTHAGTHSRAIGSTRWDGSGEPHRYSIPTPSAMSCFTCAGTVNESRTRRVLCTAGVLARGCAATQFVFGPGLYCTSAHISVCRLREAAPPATRPATRHAADRTRPAEGTFPFFSFRGIALGYAQRPATTHQQHHHSHHERTTRLLSLQRRETRVRFALRESTVIASRRGVRLDLAFNPPLPALPDPVSKRGVSLVLNSVL